MQIALTNHVTRRERNARHSIICTFTVCIDASVYHNDCAKQDFDKPTIRVYKKCNNDSHIEY